MSQATSVSKRRFDLTVDPRIGGFGPFLRSLAILDEAGANLYDEAGTAESNVLYDEIYYGGTGKVRDMHFSKRRFDFTFDARK